MIYRLYKITNQVNGKAYIGLTRMTVSKRWRNHKSKKSHCRYLHFALQKYGAENFEVEELCICLSKGIAGKLEQTLIRRHRTRVPRGYNLTAGGDIGSAHSEETKRRMRGTVNFGRKMSLEARQKMSLSQTGRRHSAATKAKMRKWHLGKKFPLESRAKMAKAKRDYWRDPRKRAMTIRSFKRVAKTRNFQIGWDKRRLQSRRIKS